MRVLLIAWQFGSKSSPRSLRWHYLSRELVHFGHEVHVLTSQSAHGSKVDSSVHLHEVFPGPLAWILMRRARRTRRTSVAEGLRHYAQVVSTSATRLNWKGRLVQYLKWCLMRAFFPGEDAQWLPWAKKHLHRLLDSWTPDIVISSHEPASCLLLGLQAKSRGLPWVADLGDPVCASYTTRRWRKKALRLEARCMHEANSIIVPNERAQALYMTRHGVDASRFFVLPQGYDDHVAVLERRRDVRSEEILELLFAGRIYPFRDPQPLLRAVIATPGVRLTMILADPPKDDLSASYADQPRIRFMPAMAHEAVREAEQAADVLVSIGNADMPAQVPGKIFEYMGVSTPIWHLCADSGLHDLPAELIERHQRGWSCWNRDDHVLATLGRLSELAREGQLAEGLNLASVPQYAFSKQGERLSEQLMRLASGG